MMRRPRMRPIRHLCRRRSVFLSNVFSNRQKKPANWIGGVYDIANQAFDAMQSTIARQKLASYPPDHIIEIARNACGTLEFDRASEMIALGYKRAQESMG